MHLTTIHLVQSPHDSGADIHNGLTILMERTEQQNARGPSLTSTAFSGISNYHIESNDTRSGISDVSAAPSLDARAVARRHFDELRRYLTSYLARCACCNIIAPSNSLSTVPEELTRLTQKQFKELSTDVYDELVRRKNSRENEVPFLPVRDDFYPKRNQACQKLAALPTLQFVDLSSAVYFEIARRYPEFQEESNDDQPSLNSVSDDIRSPRSLQTNSPRRSSEDKALDSGYGGSSSASGGPSRTVARTHFDELRQYLVAYHASEPANSRSTARQKLTRLTKQQFQDLSMDVYDELIRRKNSTKNEVPFLPMRNDFPPTRNQARQKMATMSTSSFEDLASDVYFELARQYPRFLRESDLVHMFHSKFSLDDALANFETEISPWKNPTDWLRSDVKHIDSIVHMFVTLTASIEIEQANVSGIMIYKHLIVYIFAHLMLCTNDKRLLNNFKESLQRWEAWDYITIIENHQLIKDYLEFLYQRGLQPHHDLHSRIIFDKLLSLGDVGLCAHLAVVVSDTDKYKEVLGRRGPGAQALLNLLQARLNFTISSTYKPRHLKALIRLAGASGLYPECLVLKGIDIEAHPVAGGSFGDIYKGRLLGQDIAVKVLRVYQKSDMDIILKKFSSEAVVWRQLSHPNVLPFYGIFHLDSRPGVCVACPWMENGTVVQFLANCTSHIDHTLLCLDVAGGLEYLHSENVVHGDLKGVNILVSRSQRACISDFGLATAMHSASTAVTHMTVTCMKGTPRWQAPELLPDMTNADASITERHKTKATDVYAFALVCYEIFTGKYPFYEIQNDFQVAVAVQLGKRPTRPSHNMCRTSGLTDEVWCLIEACWIKEPSERPTANSIAQRMRGLPNQLTDQRPLDNFDTSIPSQLLHKELNNPFSSLTDSIDSTSIRRS